MLAGGGVRAGYDGCASDRVGGRPSRNPVTPADVVATIYECLGVPPDLELRDRLDRPIALLPEGAPVREVFA